MRRTATALGILLACLLMTCVASVTAADLQPLIGTWKGSIDISGARHDQFKEGPDRLLVIESVEQVDGKWVIKAQYGFDEKTLQKTDIKLDGSNPVKIRFDTESGNYIRLQLDDTLKTLSGNWSSRGNMAFKKVAFTKIVP
jgi:hypothetical protein